MAELSWFFVCWCKFRKVKNYFNNFWVFVVKNGHKTLTSEWIDESSWFLACKYIFNTYTYFKYDISWDSILYLKNEWMNWADFLHAHTSVRKAKSYFGYIGSKESYFNNLFEENKKKQNLAGNKSVKA